MVTRLTGGLTPGDGADPRTFPAIWNAAADTIESQGSAISSNDTDITALQGSAVALGTAVDGLITDVETIQGWNIQDLNNVSFASAVTDGQSLVFSTAISGWTSGEAAGGGGATGAGGAINLNLNTISASYTFTDGYNGVSAGPVTIQTGATVTVGTASAWSIV